MASIAQPSPDQLKAIDLSAVSAAEAEWTKIGLQVGQDLGSYTSGKGALLHSAVESKLIATYPGVSVSALSQAATFGEAQAAATLGPQLSAAQKFVLGLPSLSSLNPAEVFAGIWSWVQQRLPRLGLILAGAVLIVLSVVLLAKAAGVNPPVPVRV